MSWSGHWHGFGPWIGAPARYAQEGGRRPPHSILPAPGAREEERYREVAAEFPTSDLPPLMTGHWLIKRNQAVPDRTWTVVAETLNWLTKHYEENPPFTREDGKQAYCTLAEKQAYAVDVLPRGVDVSWVHYTQSRNLFSAAVVCCPNHFHPDVPCPLPPS
ncbi:hypothetical protein DY245_13230 [Streptomyces inhibens]|uniref:Uncharacterized protein n=1 Tax=Streptomyces inhibens TaxID=2293571 RepID=A0A371Q5B9_STRIH|nr:hypothetical protein DY245_13230 [Streptomyces inhibens]